MNAEGQIVIDDQVITWFPDKDKGVLLVNVRDMLTGEAEGYTCLYPDSFLIAILASICKNPSDMFYMNAEDYKELLEKTQPKNKKLRFLP